MENIVFKYLWIGFIAVTLLNGLIIFIRSKTYTKNNKELEEGYKKIIFYLITLGNLPWLIMGLGIVSGYTNTIFDYFRPRDLNNIVLVFHIVTLLLMLATFNWVFFRGGAEFLEQYKLFDASNDNRSAKEIKVRFALSTAGGIIAMIALWFIDFPVMYFE